MLAFGFAILWGKVRLCGRMGGDDCTAVLARCSQCFDGPQQRLAMAQGHSEICEIVLSQIRQYGVVDMIFD